MIELTEDDVIARMRDAREGKVDLDQTRAELMAWRDRRRAAGEPLFPKAAARRMERDKRLRPLFDAGADGIESAADPVFRSWLDSQAIDPADRKAKAMAAANAAWLATATNAKASKVAERYDALKAGLATEWNLPDQDDRTVYEAIRSKMKEHDARKEMAAGIGEEALYHALEDRPMAEGWKTLAAGRRELLLPHGRDMFEIYRQNRERMEKDRPFLQQVRGLYQAIAAGEEVGKGKAPPPMGEEQKAALVDWFADLPDDRQTMAVNMLVAFARRKTPGAGEGEAVLGQMIEQLRRGGRDMARWTASGASKLPKPGEGFYEKWIFGDAREQAMRILPTEDEAAADPAKAEYRRKSLEAWEKVDQADKRWRAAAKLSGALDQVDPAVPIAPWVPDWVEQGLYDFSRSAPYTAAGFVPVAGVPAIFAATKGMRMEEYEARGISPGMADRMSDISAAVETPVEWLSNKMLLGKFPGLNKALQKLTKVDPAGGWAKVAAAAGLNVAGIWGQEMLEENIQDATPWVVQSMVGALGQDVPDVRWQEVLYGEDGLLTGERQSRLAAAVLPMALLGGGLATVQGFRDGKAANERRQALLAMGLTDKEATDILRIKDPTERAKAAAARVFELQEAEFRNAAPKVDPTGEMAMGDMEELEALAAMRGEIPTIVRDKEGAFHVELPDGTRVPAPTPAAAWEILKNAENAQVEQERQAVVEAARVMEEEGIDALVEHFETIGSGGRTGNKINFSDEAPTARNQVESGKETREDMLQTIELAGENPTGRDLSEFRIFGVNEAEVRRMVWSDVSTLFKGYNLFDLVEENSHGWWKWARWNGTYTLDEAVDWLNYVGRETKDTYLPDNLDSLSPAMRERAIDEALAKASVAWFTNKIRRSQFAPRSRVVKVLDLMAKYIQDILARAARLYKLERAGKLEGRWKEYLAASVGLDDAEIEHRLTEQANREAMEAALDPSMEILAAAKRKLPHPDDIRPGDPLAGDYRQFVDNFMRLTKRKDRMGRRLAALGKEGREFFAAKGKGNPNLDEVRQRLNESHGFTFDTVGDMLDALDESMRGRPFYSPGALRPEDSAEAYPFEFGRNYSMGSERFRYSDPHENVPRSKAYRQREKERAAWFESRDDAVPLSMRSHRQPAGQLESAERHRRDAAALREPFFRRSDKATLDAAAIIQPAMAHLGDPVLAMDLLDQAFAFPSDDLAYLEATAISGGTPSVAGLQRLLDRASLNARSAYVESPRVVIEALNYLLRGGGFVKVAEADGVIRPPTTAEADVMLFAQDDIFKQEESKAPAYDARYFEREAHGIAWDEMRGEFVPVAVKLAPWARDRKPDGWGVFQNPAREFRLERLPKINEAFKAWQDAGKVGRIGPVSYSIGMSRHSPDVWKDFPDVRWITHYRDVMRNGDPERITEIVDGKRQSYNRDWYLAKGRGSFSDRQRDMAASSLVDRIVTGPGRDNAVALLEFVQTHPDAWLTPVLGLEAPNNTVNRIPMEFAKRLGSRSGLSLEFGLHKINTTHNTGKSQRERLLTRHQFVGDVTPGRQYIIVDDVATTGATAYWFARYIESRGGAVVGVVQMGIAWRGFRGVRMGDEETLRMSPKTRAKLVDLAKKVLPSSHPDVTLNTAVRYYGIAYDWRTLTDGLGRGLYNDFPRAIAGDDKGSLSGLQRPGRPDGGGGQGGLAWAGRSDLPAFPNGLTPIPAFPGEVEASRSLPGAPVQGSLFSIGRADRDLRRLVGAVEARMADPQARAEAFARLRTRLLAIEADFRIRAARLGTDKAGPADYERENIARAGREVQAILGILPPEARYRVNVGGALGRVVDAKSDRGRVNSLLRLIREVDDELEYHLRQAYREDLGKLLKMAEARKTDTRKVSGKLGAETHDFFERVNEAMGMSADDAARATAGLEDALINESDRDRQIDLASRLEVMATFGGLDAPGTSATRLHHALRLAREVYDSGRMAWLTIIQERQDRVAEEARRVVGAMGDPRVTLGTKSRTRIISWVTDIFWGEFVSIDQLMGRLAEVTGDPTGVFRGLSDRLRHAMNDYEDRRVRRNQELRALFRETFGTDNSIQVAARLGALTDVKSKPGQITIRPARRVKQPGIPLDRVPAILAGQLGAGMVDPSTGKRISAPMFSRADLDEIQMEYDRHLAEARKLRQAGTTVRQRVLQWSKLVPGQADDMDISEMEGAYLLLLWRQKDYRPALRLHGVDETTIDEIENWLSPETRQIMEWLGQRGEMEFDEIDKLHRRLFGVGLPKVENHFRGMFEHQQEKGPANPFGDNPTGEGSGIGRAGFARHRVTHRSRPKFASALQVWQAHTAEVDWWLAHAELLTHIGQVIRRPEVADAMSAAVGDKITAAVRARLQYLENGGAEQAGGMLLFELVVSRMRAGASAALLGLRLSTLAVQATAALGSAASTRMTGVGYLRGLAGLLANPSRFTKMWQSATLRRRLEMGTSWEVRQAMQSANFRPSRFAEMARAGMLPIAWTDAAFTSISAAIAYDQGLRDAKRAGLSGDAAESSAMEFMDSVVNEVAQPVTSINRSTLENRWLNDPVKWLAFAFATEMRQKLAMTIVAARKVVTGKGPGSRVSGLRITAALALIRAMEFGIRQIYQEMTRTEDDDDDRWRDPKAWIHAILAGHLGGIPLLGQMGDITLAAALGQPHFAGPSPWVQGLGKSLSAGGKLSSGEELESKEVWDAVENILKAVGSLDPRLAPVAQVVNLESAARGIWLSATDEQAPEAAVLDALSRQQKEATKNRHIDLDREEKALRAMPEAERWQTLSERHAADPETLRELMSRLRAPALEPDEARLRKFAVAGGFRARAIAAVARVRGLEGESLEAWLNSLRAKRVLTREVEADLQKALTSDGN